MVNPVIASTRSGGPIAAAYATLRHLGETSYLRLAALTRDAVCALAGSVQLPPELLALAGSLTPEALTPDLIAGLAAGLGLGAGTDPVPDRMATVNSLLNAAPVRLRERLLVEFVGLLQRPTW